MRMEDSPQQRFNFFFILFSSLFSLLSCRHRMMSVCYVCVLYVSSAETDGGRKSFLGRDKSFHERKKVAWKRGEEKTIVHFKKGEVWWKSVRCDTDKDDELTTDDGVKINESERVFGE